MDTLKAEAFFRFLNTIIMAMPVGVPAVMIFAVVVAIQRLQWRRIAVLYPGQLKLAANVDIACFDKTGTLTGSEVNLCCTQTPLPVSSCPAPFLLSLHHLSFVPFTLSGLKAALEGNSITCS